MKTRRMVALCLLVTARMTAGGQISDEARQDFEWFAGLGHPDVKDAKWAEVWTGQSWRYGSEPPHAITTHGFILIDKVDAFRILKTDLTETSRAKSTADRSVPAWVGFEERPFKDMAIRYLADLRNPPKGSDDRFGKLLGHKSEVFFIAYACWRKGENELAQAIYDEDRKLPTDYGGGRVGNVASMRDALEIELSLEAIWDAVLRFGGGGFNERNRVTVAMLAPRSELLEIFRKIVRTYPASPYLVRAKSTVEMLEKMVREDEDHRKLTKDEMDKLPQEQRIAELIYRLRDQNGHQWGQPGSCDIFDISEEGDTPAHQLVKIGYPAVPQLIEAIADERFSRSVGYARDFFFSHHVLTIGDCSLRILERITGERFFGKGVVTKDMTAREIAVARQQAPRAWWEEFQKKGEKQLLIDAITSGEKSPGSLVRKLKVIAPDAVEDAVVRGASRARDRGKISEFSEVLGHLHSKAASEQLLAQMNGRGELDMRLRAMVQLLNQDHPEALPALIREWQSYTQPKDDHFGETFEIMVAAFIAHGQPEAMLALVKDWDLRPDFQRVTIVKQLGEFLNPPFPVGEYRGIKFKPITEAAKDIAIGLLVHALEDKDTRWGVSGYEDRYYFPCPRMCDRALYSLHKIEPSKYVMDPEGGRMQKDRERIAATNIWRVAHGKDILPAPAESHAKTDGTHSLNIVSVEVMPPDKLAGLEREDKIKALRTADFAANTIPDLLTWFATHECIGVRRLDVDAIRENDLTGVRISVRVSPGTHPSGQGVNWQMNHGGKIGHHLLGNTGGSSNEPPDAFMKSCWNEFKDKLAEGLKGPPTTDFAVSAGLGGEP